MNMSQTAAGPSQPAWLRALANRNFRLIWMGENVSLLGDQFYLVALPWLVFQMTGSSLAFGTILMVAGIPRAVFMLIGGVVTDRFSPRSVMVISNLLRLIITILLTLVVAGQTIQLWMLYVIAFCFGAVDAFFQPAYRAIIPIIVDEENLQASNSLMLGASQIVQMTGPGIAGVMVRSVGAVLSFAFDAITFLFTSVMLLLMRVKSQPQKKAKAGQRRSGILIEIRQMLVFVRSDSTLFTVILIIAAVNFLFNGPIIVGTAALAKVRFVEGSAAFGAMLSTFAAGALMGTLVAGAVRPRRSGLISLALVGAEGVFMVGLAYAPTLPIACGLLALIGIGAGFGNVTVITLTQKRVSKDLMGRFMSVVVLAELGLTPISNAAAGVLADWNVTGLFVLSGVLLTLTCLAAATRPDMRAVQS